MAEATDDGSQNAAPIPDGDRGAVDQAPAAGADTTAGAVERAQTSEPTLDRDARALEILDGGASGHQARKELDQATPASVASAQPAGTGQETSELPPAASAGYDGLASKDRQALSQTSLLPDQDTWNQFTPTVRQNLLVSAKRILGEKTRLFQRERAIEQERNPRGQFSGSPTSTPAAAPSNQSTSPAAGTPTGQEQITQSPDGGGGHAGQPALRDVRAQDPEQGQRAQAQAPVQPRQAAFDKFRQFAQKVEDPQITDPLLEGLEDLQKLHDEELQTRDKQVNYVTQRLIAREEKDARSVLASEIPNLTDEQFEGIKQRAKVFAQAAYSAGEAWTWEDALLQAGRASSSPNIRQAVQQELATKRRQTLSNTPERGTAQQRPHRAADKNDQDRMALELLDSGRTLSDVRADLHG